MVFAVTMDEVQETVADSWKSVDDLRADSIGLAPVLLSEIPFQAIFEETPVGIFVWDLSGRIVLANKALQTMIGYSADELSGKHWRTITHPDDHEPQLGLESQPVDGEPASQQREMRYICKGGGLMWGNVHVSTVRDGDGKPQFGIAIIEDMTDRKLAQNRLRESEELYRTLVETSPDAVLLFDPEGTVVMANNGAAALHGYADSRRLLGLSGPVLLSEKIWGQLMETTHSAMYPGIHDSRECMVPRANGAPVPVEVRMTPIRGEAGEVKWFLGWERDISDHVLAKQALEYQALHDGLTGLPNRSLLNDRLGQTVRAAKREETSFALLLLDLDRFKHVNDTFGHYYGDLLLQQLGARLVAALRASDTVARLGGDEFAMLLPWTDERGAIEAIQKLLQVFDRPFVLEGESVNVEGSIGIAVYPDHGEDVSALMRHADDAMYAAKRRRLGYSVYQDQIAALES